MDADPRTDPYLRSHLVAVARRNDAWVLANAVADAPAHGSTPAGAKALNLNVLFRPDGTVEGTYAKRHLVPFGEYVPFRSFLQPRIGVLDQIPRDFEPGHKPGLFDSRRPPGRARSSASSRAFGYQVRPLVHAGAQVIVVSTNNRSYERSANSAQHVAIGQMRAAETGRPVVQAAISGISAIIDADGVVHERTELFDRTVLEATVTATTGETPYVRYGEWVIWMTRARRSLVAVAFALRPRARRSSFIESAPPVSRAVGSTGHERAEGPDRTDARGAALRADRRRPVPQGRWARRSSPAAAPRSTAARRRCSSARRPRRASARSRSRSASRWCASGSGARSTAPASARSRSSASIGGVEPERPRRRVVRSVPDAGPTPSVDRRRRTPRRPTNGATPAGDTLPIPGYDALSASQVVERLAGLTPDELDAVRAYESAHRHRRTILGKIEQISG